MKKIFLLIVLALFLSSCVGSPCSNCLADPNYYDNKAQGGLGGLFYSLSDAMDEKIKSDQQRRANTVKCYPDVYGQTSTTYTCR